MRYNKLAYRLYKMQIGDIITLQKGDQYEGTFIRVPSGWIYRYTYRGNPTSCFIPYTEEVSCWDMDLEIYPCPSCLSTNVLLHESTVADIVPPYTKNVWEIKCSICGANSGMKNTKEDAINTWNDLRGK